MTIKSNSINDKYIKSFIEFSQLADYSFMNFLNADPRSKKDGNDHRPRPVYSGHYVTVTPIPIPEPEYVSHSNKYLVV